MLKSNNIFLVGPMGAGKTSVGRFLAQELKRDFYDSDSEIESRTGVDITWIFDLEGEQGFREREEEIIDELSKKNRIVLATGGGVVLNPNNCKRLASRGIVVYLKATVVQQLDRTAKDKRRPLLQKGDKEKTLEELLQKRAHLYEDISDIVVDTDGQTVKAVGTEIIKLLRGS